MLNIYRKLYKTLTRHVLRPKLNSHYQASIICSPEGTSGPNPELVGLAGDAIKLAWPEHVIAPKKNLSDNHYYNVFPGEHYRLLKSIVKLLDPNIVIEIGTFTGMGSVAMHQGLNRGTLHTFDILPWNSFDSHLDASMFADGRIQQHLSDLSNPAEFSKYFDLLNKADLIFLDAPKDGVFEYRFIDLLKKLDPKPNKLMIIDDIRFVNMVNFWRDIQSPKLDITSFGHWSGTGLVDLSNGLVDKAA